MQLTLSKPAACSHTDWLLLKQIISVGKLLMRGMALPADAAFYAQFSHRPEDGAGAAALQLAAPRLLWQLAQPRAAGSVPGDLISSRPGLSTVAGDGAAPARPAKPLPSSKAERGTEDPDKQQYPRAAAARTAKGFMRLIWHGGDLVAQLNLAPLRMQARAMSGVLNIWKGTAFQGHLARERIRSHSWACAIYARGVWRKVSDDAILTCRTRYWSYSHESLTVQLLWVPGMAPMGSGGVRGGSAPAVHGCAAGERSGGKLVCAAAALTCWPEAAAAAAAARALGR